jgi:hypothetical protein
MYPSYVSALAFIVWTAVFLLAILIVRFYKLPDDEELGEVPPPLEPDEYEAMFERNRQGYLDAMSQYDKLVPWASGGALVVSLTFIRSFAPVAQPWTKWILGAAWLALVGALLSSILSQYSSTRIKVWGRRYLEARQNPPGRRKKGVEFEKWKNEAIGFDRLRRRHGRNTKLLNVLAGILLSAGLLLLGVFALVAVPFGSSG